MSPLHDTTEWRSVPDWATSVVAEMNVPLDRFGVVPDLINAVTDYQGTVLIGEPLLRKLSSEQLQCVVAHELAHPKWVLSSGARWAKLVAALLVKWIARSFGRISPIAMVLAWQTIVPIFTDALRQIQTALNWCEECGTDLIASQYVRCDVLISTLTKLDEMQDASGESSLTHPPLWLRSWVLTNLTPPAVVDTSSQTHGPS
jgi:Zn-dependent protease with chaperone function